MSREVKDIKKDLNAIKKMTEAEGRLGFAIDNAINEQDNSYDDMGRYLVRVAEAHPDQLNVIEETVIAICGYSFGTLRDRMKTEKSDYDAL